MPYFTDEERREMQAAAMLKHREDAERHIKNAQEEIKNCSNVETLVKDYKSYIKLIDLKEDRLEKENLDDHMKEYNRLYNDTYKTIAREYYNAFVELKRVREEELNQFKSTLDELNKKYGIV